MNDIEFEKRREDTLRFTEKTDAAAETAVLHGVRETVRLEGREIKTAFYKADEPDAPVIFAFYGGGFVIGNYAYDDNMHDTLRRRLRANVISVNYRHATTDPFPSALNDCYETMLYYINNPAYSFDRKRITVFGSSAGANLASAVCILANRRKEFKISAQILNYPVTDMVEEDWIYKNSVPALLDVSRFYSRAYASADEQLNPLVSPIYAGENDFDRELVTIISVAEHDDLCFEGVIFANQLKSRGMTVLSMTAKGQGHGFFEQCFRIDKDKKYWSEKIIANIENGSMEAETERMIKLAETYFLNR